MGEIADQAWDAAFEAEENYKFARQSIEARCRAQGHEPQIKEDDEVIWCAVCGASADPLG